jgi:hypothetical protein
MIERLELAERIESDDSIETFLSSIKKTIVYNNCGVVLHPYGEVIL